MPNVMSYTDPKGPNKGCAFQNHPSEVLEHPNPPPEMGSQLPSHVKPLCNFAPQIWLEMIASRDAKVLVLKAPGRRVT